MNTVQDITISEHVRGDLSASVMLSRIGFFYIVYKDPDGNVTDTVDFPGATKMHVQEIASDWAADGKVLLCE